MAGRLAAVPEWSTDGAKADHPPVVGLYRVQIQAVDLSVVRRRSTIFGHGGSGSSSAPNSCPSTNSAYSSGSASAVALEHFGNQDLGRIARQMVSDGHTGRMVEEFVEVSPAPALKFGGSPDHALKNWFSELDVDWVLQIHDEPGLRRLLRDKPASTPQDLVERWIRALTVIVASITELLFAFHTTPAVVQFSKASITELFDVVDVIITVLEAEKLQAVLDLFTCVCRELYILSMFNENFFFPAKVFDEIGGPFQRQAKRLGEITASTMEKVRTHVEEDDSWAIEIPRGGGEVHNNTRFIMDCIVSMKNAHTSMRNSAPHHYSENLGGLIDGTIDYLKALLFTKSESCSDQSLRYLFLVNNSYFIARVVFESSGSFIPKLWYLTLPPECKKYMDSYLNVSWGPVLSCLPKLRSPGLIHHLINTPSLAKFESSFHKTYQAQKFWKVPDPKLRNDLRRAITERVISGYSDYLEEHPELKKHVGCESSSPEVLEEMLGELFEG